MQIRSLLVFGFLITALALVAQKPPVYQVKNVAIKGYDPVSYFVDSEAKQGSDEYSFEWNGSRWYFESQENLKKFSENPDLYAPEFGGYCAYAISQGYTYQSNPEAWKIVDGKLYLNYSFNIQKKWEANQEEVIKSANNNWPKVLNE